MRIKIELTSTEVNKLKKVTTNITKEISVAVDQEFTKDDEKELKARFDENLNSTHKSKIGDINCYDASVENAGKGTIININLKTSFVTSLLNITEIFYSQISQFILKIKDPFEKFVEKFMI